MAHRSVEGLAPLAATCDALILDLWGTLHDGVRPYPHALATIERLREAGKGMVVLSNAPRRASEVGGSLHALGFPDDLAEKVMCSGEEVWLALAGRRDPWYRRLGRRVFHLGPARDRGLLDNPGCETAASLARAEFVLCTGLDRPEETVADYRPILAEAAALGLPMICANPDFEVLRDGQRELCAGALARAYADEFGGEVRWHGKPYGSVFESALDLCGTVARERVLVVGDSLRTDIAGARAAGLGACFVTGGLALAELGGDWGALPQAAALDRLFAATGVTPDWVVPAFRW